MILLLLVLGTALAMLAAAESCPKCGAPLEPGAAFCTRCGYKLEATAQQAPAPPAPADPRASVVKVSAIHDKELTSFYGMMVYGSKMQIDSIVGSAFAIAPGQFLTDAGLIAGSKEIVLLTHSGRSTTARILGIDPLIGVALLAADLPEIPLLQARSEDSLRVGESLQAIGFPAGQQTGRTLSSSAGVLSGLHRGGMAIHPIEDYLQTDVALPRGFAGGPVVDARGRLVGMSTAFVFGGVTHMGPEVGIGLAIPNVWIERALSWIRSGQPPHAWLGARLVPADPVALKAYRLGPETRLIVDQVFPGSPAQTAGLARGDGVAAIEGQRLEGLTPVQERLLASRPGDTWRLEIERGDRRTSLQAVLATRPGRPLLAGTDALRLYGGFEVDAKDPTTVAVARVLPGSIAADQRLERGEILQEVYVKKDPMHAQRDTDRWRSVKTIDDLERLLKFAYSDSDFFVGLRFKTREGRKREFFVWEILTATDAL